MYQLKQTVVCIDIKGRDFSHYIKGGIRVDYKLYDQEEKYVKIVDGKDIRGLTFGNRYKLSSIYDNTFLIKGDDGEYTKFRKDRFVSEEVFRSLQIKKLKELCSNQVK